MIIPLDVCCNDPANGLFDHCAPWLSILDLELCAKRDPAPRFVELSGGFRLSGKVWKIDWSKEWHGNWCWNRYRLYHPRTPGGWLMVDFLTWLKKRGLYTPDAGPTELFEWFSGERNSSPADVHGWLADMWRRTP